MSVADCSESSVLRARTLSPYVPLRRTPSESVSATDIQGLGAGTHSVTCVSATGHTGLRCGVQFRKEGTVNKGDYDEHF